MSADRRTPTDIDRRLRRAGQLGLVNLEQTSKMGQPQRWEIVTTAGDVRVPRGSAAADLYLDGLMHGAWARERDADRCLTAMVGHAHSPGLRRALRTRLLLAALALAEGGDVPAVEVLHDHLDALAAQVDA